MNINKTLNLNFGKVYVNTEKMGYRAKELARQFELEIDYADSINQLDNFGVDVAIVADKKSPKDKIEFYLFNREIPTEIAKTKKGKIFKSQKKIILSKLFSKNRAEKFQYKTNSDDFIEHANQLVQDIKNQGIII